MSEATTEDKITLDDILNHQKSQRPAPGPDPDEPIPDGGDGGASVFDEPTGGGGSGDPGRAEPGGEKTKGSSSQGMWGDPTKASFVQAKAYSRILDRMAAVGLNGIAGGTKEERKQYQADPEDLEDIEYLMAVVIEFRHIHWPPEAILGFFLLLVYGAKIPGAVDKRRARNTGKSNSKPRTDNEPVVEDVVAEEVSDEEVDLQAELFQINQQARAAGLEQLKHYDVPAGSCVYHWVILGESVPVGWGQNFKDLASFNRWKKVCYDYEKNGIPMPTNLR